MASRSRALLRSVHRLPHTQPRVQSRLATHSQQRSVATYTSPSHASQISILQTSVDKNSDGFKENAAALGELTRKIAQLHEKTAEGGSQKARDKHVQRGKMLVRDRVTALIDPGTSFLELSALAAHGVYEGEDVPAAGMVTGIGTVEGVMCMIVANDST
jgi:3-methylcrotonyl-CoA carboxylase beta subunit